MENTTQTTHEIHSNVLKNGIGNAKDAEMHKQSGRPMNAGQDAAADMGLLGVASESAAAWYALNVSNNNNALNAAGAVLNSKAGMQTAPGAMNASFVESTCWSCEQYMAAASAAAIEMAGGASALFADPKLDLCRGDSEVDKGGGGEADGGGGGGDAAELKFLTQLNDIDYADAAAAAACGHTLFAAGAALNSQLSPESTACCITAASNYMLAGAAAPLTPPANSSSNRTSVNNSTDNLSYSSDNYYADELIVLQSTLSTDDIDDEEAEKISLYSDDCVYAYRGEGADYELTLAAMNNRGHYADDETDFLEMDFEPDPLSEVEGGCGGVGGGDVGVGGLDVASSYLMQRDACTLSAPPGHTHMQRQLYSSPIDNLLVAPQQKSGGGGGANGGGVGNGGGLQSQSSLLSKNFARIALHLDQIKADETTAGGSGNRRDSVGQVTAVEIQKETAEPLAHSLPNSLLGNFGRDAQGQQELQATSPSKITGAKPKRLNTFSTSSSTSSKTSSKSRNSVRSSLATAAGGLSISNSFDERSASCTDFRCNAPNELGATSSAVVPTNVSSIVGPSNSNAAATLHADETCLDCLEKEFLANTIGKAMDLSECPKCRKRRAINNLYVSAAEVRCRNSASHQLKSTSLCYEYNDLPSDCLYATAVKNDFLPFHRSEQPRDRNLPLKLMDRSATHIMDRSLMRRGDGREASVGIETGGCGAVNQRSTCDIFNNKHLLKNILTEKEIVTISTQNLDEETLVQALDKLHVAYNAELIKTHFKPEPHPPSNAHKQTKEFKSLKHLILHTSKQYNNYPRYKRLIEIATRGNVEVSFKKDPLITKTEMVPLKVADILIQWAHSNNLEPLKRLDKRFQNANVLGKIANIIRQAQQRCSPRRPLPEFISIPQYYASGYLNLTKKC